jgi:hypothetical protein
VSFTSTFPTNIVKFSAVLAVRTITVSDAATGTEAVSSRLIGALDSGVGAEAPLVNLVTRDVGVGSETVSSRLASLIDAATGVDKSLPVSIPELIFRSFSECVESLRYVSYGTPVESRDLNMKTTCIKLMRDTLDKYRYKLYVPASIVDPLIDKLDSVLATIRYVKSGDIIQPEDHNYVVDALKKARDILSEIESYCAGIKDELDKCRADLDKCQLDLQACQALIKPGYSVVPWEIRPQVTVPEKQAASDIKFVLEYTVS